MCHAAPALLTLAVHRDTSGVAIVEMSRPAFDEVMVGELANTFEALSVDPVVRAIVLSGQGNVFSMGAALPRVKRANRAIAEWSVSDARAFAWMLWRIDSCAKPTIARVNGMTVGSGVGLICACDFVVASGEASFTVAETDVGLVPSPRRDRQAMPADPWERHERLCDFAISRVAATNVRDTERFLRSPSWRLGGLVCC